MDTPKTSSGFSVAHFVQKNPLRLVAIVLRIIIIIFAAVTALCGIVALSKVEIESGHAAVIVTPNLLKIDINTNTLICGSLFLLTSGVTLLYEIIILIKCIVSKDQNTKVLSIVETVLGSISAAMFFSLAIALANSVNEYVQYTNSFRNFGVRAEHPLIMPDQATAAFGFLTTFAIAGLIVFLWIKFYIEKSRAA